MKPICRCLKAPQGNVLAVEVELRGLGNLGAQTGEQTLVREGHDLLQNTLEGCIKGWENANDAISAHPFKRSLESFLF